jgi:hypothetical protein
VKRKLVVVNIGGSKRSYNLGKEKNTKKVVGVYDPSITLFRTSMETSVSK